MSIDNKIIIILGLCAALVMMMDDRVSERWCDTYKFCEDAENVLVSNEPKLD